MTSAQDRKLPGNSGSPAPANTASGMDQGRVVLAPMEGVLDYAMRRLLTEINRYDWCVSEFVRVSEVVLPEKVILKEAPELSEGGVTAAGTPVWVQLLGSRPDTVAASALVAVKLGAPGIDLNFGCPSRLVNRSLGGAAVLRTPDLVGDVARAVRDMVPPEIPVSAKIRLGWADAAEAPEIIRNLDRAGVSLITIHARTRHDVYAPGTVKWEAVKPLRELTSIPMIINGDIIDPESCARARELSGLRDVMVGRQAVAVPNLERVLRGNAKPFDVRASLEACLRFAAILSRRTEEHFIKARIKQFLGYVRKARPEIQDLFREVCRNETLSGILAVIEAGIRNQQESNQTGI
ncbi:MAG: tRNA-dihydrouridine synthase [Succinimonas sp.]|nr:tRNA-dihydrouridine synthase [Succinimonas sp.]